ncbi:MAG: thiamine diphosphokinase [Quinella sp. 1Q5]|nr:thiamine diphosphokinase [Quinella sp. 1Q5]
MRLPQCEVSSPTTAQEILFVSGGRPPSVDWFKGMTDGRKIFCVDKGIELCKACGVVPNRLIGDFDSANQSSVSWARANNVPVERYPVDKDFTDTQLALSRAAELFGDHTAILTGAFGGRIDHLYSTIFTCAALNRAIVLADEREIIFYLHGGEEATIKFFSKPFAASLLPMTSTCRGVTTKNLHWELDSATLTQDFPNATSNRIEHDEIFISVGGGVLAVYLCFAE